MPNPIIPLAHTHIAIPTHQCHHHPERDSRTVSRQRNHAHKHQSRGDRRSLGFCRFVGTVPSKQHRIQTLQLFCTYLLARTTGIHRVAPYRLCFSIRQINADRCSASCDDRADQRSYPLLSAVALLLCGGLDCITGKV